MKITIEVDDDALRHKIDEQLGATISKLGTEWIQQGVGRVMSLKFQRLDASAVDNLVKVKAGQIINQTLGYNPRLAVDRALAEAARTILREQGAR